MCDLSHTKMLKRMIRMKLKIRHHLMIIMGAVLLIFTGCSSSALNEYSPEQVIDNALSENKELHAYYGESEWTFLENGVVTESFTMREWRRQDGKRRIETLDTDGNEEAIAVNDGERLLMYMPAEESGYIFEDEELAELNEQSPKEHAAQMLHTIQDTHTVEVNSEEKIAGRLAFHLEAKTKNDKDLLGNQEIWIDKKNWIVLKTKSQSNGTEAQVEYTKIEFDVKMSDELFTLEFPDHIEVENLEDAFESKDVTFEEAQQQLGNPFFYISETDTLDISTIELLEIGGDINRKEVSIMYEQEGLPYFSLNVYETETELDEELDAAHLPDEESIKIRGQSGTSTEELMSIKWNEENMTYMLMGLSPNLTIDELVDVTKKMVRVE